MKSWAKRRFPSFYHRLSRLKKLATPQTFENYYQLDDSTPAIALCTFVDRLPSYLDTLFIPGCAPGRDFRAIPELKPVGIDLALKEDIKWQCHCEYEQISVEEWTQRLAYKPIDLSRTLVFTNGLLMWIGRRQQYAFYEAITACGCKNMIFQEPPPTDPEYGRGRGEKFFHLDGMRFKVECHHPTLLTWSQIDGL